MARILGQVNTGGGRVLGQIQPQAPVITPQKPKNKGIFGRLMDIPSKLKSEVETQAQATKESFGDISTRRAEGQDIGSTLLQLVGGTVRAGVIDPVVSIAKTGASLLTEGQKERGSKIIKDVAQPFSAGLGELSDKISNIPAIQKFAETPEATTLEKNYEAILNLTAILPMGEARPLLKASGLGKVEQVIHDVAWKVSDEVSDASKTIFAKSESKLEQSVVKKFEKGVKPLIPGKSTPTQVTKYKTSVVDAVKTINENKAGLKYLQDTGEIISGKAPASLQQFADSVEQTKKVIFKQYDALAQQSGKAGNVIDLTKVAKELDSVINSPSLAISNPQAIAYAQNAKNNLLKFGSIDTATTQDVVQQFNAKLSAFYRNPTPDGAGNSVIDAMIANSLRQEADTFITGLTGTEYSALKGKYGSLKAIERDVIKANLRNARKNTKGLIDFTDIFTGADVVTGMLTMNPATLARGVIMRGLKEYYKYVNDPNNIIKKMFNDMEKLYKFKTAPLTKPKGLGDLGLSIKDVSGEVNQSFLGKPKSSLQNTPQSKTPIPAKNVIPKATTKQSTLSTLQQEAKKFKSADEFVESKQSIFHGTPAKIEGDLMPSAKLGKGQHATLFDGIFFTQDRGFAESFARRPNMQNLNKITNPEIKTYISTLRTKISEHNKLIDDHFDDFESRGWITNDNYERFIESPAGKPLYDKAQDNVKRLESFRKNSPKLSTKERELLFGQGGVEERFIVGDVVEIPERVGFAGKREEIIRKNQGKVIKIKDALGKDEFIVTDPSQIKTKSQLKDIYNKANKPLGDLTK